MTRRAEAAPDARADDALLAAMAAGDDGAGVAFVRRYQRRVYGIAFSILSERMLAEEVAQEAFLRVWRHASVFDARRGPVAAWIATITRNLAVDALRMRRSISIDPDALLALSLASREPDPVDAAVERHETGRVAAALRDLPREQRRAVVLSAYYGLTAAEVAAREDVPLGTAKTRIRSGMIRLRDAVAAVPNAGPERSHR